VLERVWHPGAVRAGCVRFEDIPGVVCSQVALHSAHLVNRPCNEVLKRNAGVGAVLREIGVVDAGWGMCPMRQKVLSLLHFESYVGGDDGGTVGR